MAYEFENNKIADWANIFSRTSGVPLDRSELFDSIEDAEAYAKGDNSDKRKIGKASWVGQIISVVEGNEVNAFQIRLKKTEGTNEYTRVLQKLTGEGQIDPDIDLSDYATIEYADAKLDEAKEYTDEEIAKAVISGGGGVIVDGSVTTDKIADGAVTSDKLSNDVKSKVDSVPVLSGKLNSLFWSQATFSITATPSVIYANTDTSVTFKATFTSSSIDALEVDDIRITSDSGYSSILKQAQGTKTIDYSETLNLVAKGSRTRYAKILVGTNTKNASVTVYAYNKMYYGALTSAPTSDNYNNMTLLTASSTARSKTLTFTSKADGSAFYLIVPSDVTQPTGCTNESGVDQGFTQLEDITINSITYKRYRLGGASYNQGVSFTFKTK
jgi:hypothetical protein